MLSHVQLCDHMGCSLSGSSVHGIFQARILEWVAISYSKESCRPRDQGLLWQVDSQDDHSPMGVDKMPYMWTSWDITGQRTQIKCNIFNIFYIHSTQKAFPGACVYLKIVYMLQNAEIQSLGKK